MKRRKYPLLFSTVIQIIGVVCFNWDRYAIMNVWLLSVLLLAIQDIFFSFQEKKTFGWWVDLLSFLVLFIPFAVLMTVVIAIIFSGSPILHIPGGLTREMFIHVMRDNLLPYWMLFAMVCAESLYEFITRWKQKERLKRMTQSRSLKLIGLGIVFLLIAGASTAMLSSRSLRQMETILTMLLLLSGLFASQREKEELSPLDSNRKSV